MNPQEFRVGERVVFVRRADPLCASDDPLYEAAVPAGVAGIVVKVADTHIRVRLEDPRISPEPVRVWRDGLFPDRATNVLSSLRRCEPEEDIPVTDSH